MLLSWFFSHHFALHAQHKTPTLCRDFILFFLLSMRQCCTRVVRWRWFWLWKQSWGNVAGLLHDKPFLPIPILLACHFDHFSLTSGTGYESHPPEVKLGKVVSGLLRGVDVCLLRWQAILFSLTSRRWDSWCSPQTTAGIHLRIALQGNFFGARMLKELSSANQQGPSPHLPFPSRGMSSSLKCL